MQLYAVDISNQLIPAWKAGKHQNYYCLECGGIVRLRGGIHRRNHYFHLNPALTCRLNGKSMCHIQVQCRLQNILPTGECQLEMRFPSINRIADAVWTKQRLIFEVQCSPISAEEIKARNTDYASLGYQVIWILHDNQFNQIRLSGAELCLKGHPHFFSNIDADGNGIIYDQFDISSKGLRKSKLPRLDIDISQPLPIPKKTGGASPLISRFQTWTLYFEGDLIHQFLIGSDYAKEAERLEFLANPPRPSKTLGYYVHWCWNKCIRRPYKAMFQLLLERACR